MLLLDSYLSREFCSIQPWLMQNNDGLVLTKPACRGAHQHLRRKQTVNIVANNLPSLHLVKILHQQRECTQHLHYSIRDRAGLCPLGSRMHSAPRRWHPAAFGEGSNSIDFSRSMRMSAAFRSLSIGSHSPPSCSSTEGVVQGSAGFPVK